MNILVTGGTGDVGRSAVARLVANGHQVRVIGRRAGMHIRGAEYRQCDIADWASLRSQVKDVQGIVHLAAIRHPSLGPGQEIFRVNCLGTFHVYQAAAEAGIGRVVTASSINAFGYNFGVRSFELLYFPIDEAHLGSTTDAYSFSKQILEETAAYFWRREGISGVCLRLPAVYELDAERSGGLIEFVIHSRQAYQAFLNLPQAQRAARVEQIISRFEDMRAARTWEQPQQRLGMDLADAGLMFGRSNFWTSIDARDAAQAIEKGLTADYEGSHPIFVNDSHNFTGIESEMLVQTFYPGVEGRGRVLNGTETLVSIDKARGLIGFEPEHSIQAWAEHQYYPH